MGNVFPSITLTNRSKQNKTAFQTKKNRQGKRRRKIREEKRYGKRERKDRKKEEGERRK